MSEPVSPEPVSLYAEFEAIRGARDRVAELVAGYAEQVRAEAGNLVFEAHRLGAAPNHFFVYERYTDRAAFDAHLAAEHCAAFNAELTPLVVGGGSVLTMLEPLGA